MHTDEIDWSHCPDFFRPYVSESLDLTSMLAKFDSAQTKCYVIFCGPGCNNWKQLQDRCYDKPIVIFISSDALCTEREFNWYQDSKPLGLLELEKICYKNPDKTFLIVTQDIGLENLIEVSNLHIIGQPYWWIGLSKSVRPLNGYDKKESLYRWALFNKDVWWHRVAALSYLLSKKLDVQAFITVSDHFIDRCKLFKRIHDFLPWRFTDNTLDLLDIGYQRLLTQDINRSLLPPLGDPNILGQCSWNEMIARNGNQILLPIRQQTRLEIVTGTLFGESTIFFTEKDLQAIYGCNFMIFNATAGHVKSLRDMGLDMFDDVVDHDYDLIPDPGKRLIRSFENNLHLLDGSTDLDQLWLSRKHRFVHNCQLLDDICTSLPNKILKEWKVFFDNVAHKQSKQTS